MRRSLIIIGLIVLFIVPPIFIILSRNWPKVSRWITVMTVSKLNKNNTQYSVVNEVPDYTLKITNTAYIDFIAAQLGIFKDDGVIDPAYYLKRKEVKTRYTVSKVRFELVPSISPFILAVDGKKSFAGFGTYTIENDTLVVKIALNFDDPALSAKQNSAEEVFLDVAYQTMYFALGAPVAPGGYFIDGFNQNKQDIADYVSKGVFEWPVSIRKTP